ncbi:MAG: hypothetical protein IJ681_00885 [Bacteroidales bacterium]|nr:hypothetical protein [Bacteroidales bacterium]
MNRMSSAKISEVGNEPFTITGIVAGTPFYFFAGQMHRELNLDFIRVPDFEFYDKVEDKCISVATYVYFDDVNGFLYILVSNNFPIIKNLGTPDILLFVIGRDCFPKTEKIIKDIRKKSFAKFCKRFYYTEDDKCNDEEYDSERNETTVQLNAFSDGKKDPYDSVKRKRRNAVKGFAMDESTITNLKEDLEINLKGELLNVL